MTIEGTYSILLKSFIMASKTYVPYFLVLRLLNVCFTILQQSLEERVLEQVNVP